MGLTGSLWLMFGEDFNGHKGEARRSSGNDYGLDKKRQNIRIPGLNVVCILDKSQKKNT